MSRPRRAGGSAERGGRTLRGREVAVYRIRNGQVAEAWFYPDDPRTVDAFWADER